jgi:hypothetical protein
MLAKHCTRYESDAMAMCRLCRSRNLWHGGQLYMFIRACKSYITGSYRGSGAPAGALQTHYGGRQGAGDSGAVAELAASMRACASRRSYSKHMVVTPYPCSTVVAIFHDINTPNHDINRTPNVHVVCFLTIKIICSGKSARQRFLYKRLKPCSLMRSTRSAPARSQVARDFVEGDLRHSLMVTSTSMSSQRGPRSAAGQPWQGERVTFSQLCISAPLRFRKA